MKCAAYLRVSSNSQDVSNQLPELEAFAKARNWEITGYYAENESSWRVGHQKELARLLDALRSGARKYDVCLVWSLDRLCRGGIPAIFTLISSFRQYGCAVISVKESWTETATGPMAELLTAIVAWVGKFESDRKSERVYAGLARARKEGKTLGRPAGSKDKKPRHKAGYVARWMGKEKVTV